MDSKKFDQSKYMYQWQKENMKSVSVRYNAAFVDEFRNSLDKLGLKQSDVIRDAMISVIEQARKK